MDRRKRIHRILMFTVLTILCLAALYFFLGLPGLPAEMAMHMEEAMHWVGPSKVIASGEAGYGRFDSFILGETEYGYCLYEYSLEERWDHGELTYIGKNEDRVCFLPDRYYLYADLEVVLPVYAIPGNAEAASARLTLETVSDRDPEFFTTHTAQSQLHQGCYFRFDVDMTNEDLSVPQVWNFWLTGDQFWGPRMRGTMTLELFDRDGNLIETRVTEFPSNT